MPDDAALKHNLNARYGDCDDVWVTDRDGEGFHVSFGDWGYRIRRTEEEYELEIAPFHEYGYQIDCCGSSILPPDSLPGVLIRAENELRGLIERQREWINETQAALDSVQPDEDG